MPGFGELFIIRIAGNVISPEVMGTLQYAAVHLHTPLFVVLGHEGCGAVQAAVAMKEQGARERAGIALLLDRILPGLPDRDTALTSDEKVAAAVEANVRWSMHQLLDTPEGQARMAEGIVKLVGAVYELKTGHVRFLTQSRHAITRVEVEMPIAMHHESGNIYRLDISGVLRRSDFAQCETDLAKRAEPSWLARLLFVLRSSRAGNRTPTGTTCPFT